MVRVADPFESRDANTAAYELSPEAAVLVEFKPSLPRRPMQAQDECRSVGVSLPGRNRRPRESVSLVPEGLDRVHLGGSPGRIEPEEDADGDRDPEREQDRASGHDRLLVG